MAIKKVKRNRDNEPSGNEKEYYRKVEEIKNEEARHNSWKSYDIANEVEQVVNVEQGKWNNNIAPNVINTTNREYWSTLKEVEDTELYHLISFSDYGVSVLRQARFPEEEYDFHIDTVSSRLDVRGMYESYDQLFITFSLSPLDSDVPGQLILPYTVTSNSSSKFVKFLSSFKEIFRGKIITEKQLVGLSGRCSLSHFETESGDVYEQIKVLKVNQPK